MTVELREAKRWAQDEMGVDARLVAMFVVLLEVIECQYIAACP